MHGHEPLLTGTRILVKVLQDLVCSSEPYESYGDLKEDFKCRCAKLRIPYDSTLITQALAQLERGGEHPLVTVDKPPLVHAHDPTPITKAEAARLLDGLTGAMKTMPAATGIANSPEVARFEEEAARRRAWVMGVELDQ